jgi:hypothetical protein
MSKIRKVITSQDITASVLLKANMPEPLITTEELQYSIKKDKFNFILIDEEQDDKLEAVHQLLQEEQLYAAVSLLEYDMILSDIAHISNETDSKKTFDVALTEDNDNTSLWWILAGVSSAVIFNDSGSTVSSPTASEPETVGFSLLEGEELEWELEVPAEILEVLEVADVDNDGKVDSFIIDVNGAIAELIDLDDPNGGEFDLANFSPDEFTATLFHNGQESGVSLLEADGYLAGLVDNSNFSYLNYDSTDYIQLIGNGFTYNYSIYLDVL